MLRFDGFVCPRCAARFRPDLAIDSRGCPLCAATAPANLQVVYPAPVEGQETAPQSPGRLPSLWRYAAMLPVDEADAVSLGEGLTPLVPVPGIGARLGLTYLYIKDETRNPTWSHKDRFSTVAVSAARSLGARVVATSSSGNAGASLGAYAARAGLTAVVVTFAETAGTMIDQARKYGAIIVPMRRKADRWQVLAEGMERHGWFVTSPFRTPVVGSHPIGIEGYKTLAYELAEQLDGRVPDWCVVPVCYGDALAGLWRGFKELRDHGRIDRLPRLVAAEVHGSLAAALARQEDSVPDLGARFATLAVSLGASRSAYQALAALRESDGFAIPVGNEGLLALQEDLASLDGMFAELSSVTPLAAISLLRRNGTIGAGDTVVAVATASGLKDIDLSRPRKGFGTGFNDAADALRHVAQAADNG
ncbi:Threonine synthase [Chelatococcus sambhunathii]|uniref:Threonine synthase n=1 Tax=Chelatococcus sambhunathii TaxID=363953 RepID=A0ABP2ABZ9_9HYPH|nr:threonine synthase [Chelatococcus sambhunathii]CUA89248.1 Threonine synthase [Chelatococcus sambhunathii]